MRSYTKHGLHDSPEYQVWYNIKNRCTNPNVKGYNNYGGRGIMMHKEWFDSFEAFYKDMGPRPGPEYSIERENVNGNYEPGNCSWKTIDVQARNRRSNVYITYKGETKIMTDWAREFNMTPQIIARRLNNGFTADQIFNSPKYTRKSHLENAC